MNPAWEVLVHAILKPHGFHCGGASWNVVHIHDGCITLRCWGYTWNGHERLYCGAEAVLITMEGWNDQLAAQAKREKENVR